ncbi:MAG: hypothetical protein FJ255_10945 [Phycisphaerae bacterium]|nr:hypothetical protein [Phycisphaerae bacterium]
MLELPIPAGLPTLAVNTDPVVLVSWWKALLILPPLVAWLWIVSTVFDKFCARFFLPREKWNLVHLLVGLLALGVAVSFPVQAPWGFFVGWAIMVAVLTGHVFLFMAIANKDERVPAEKRMKVDFSALRSKDHKPKQAAKASELVIRNMDKQALPIPEKETPEFALRVAAEGLYLKALEGRASQIDVGSAGKDQTYAAAFLVDGVRVPGPTMPAGDAFKLIDFWKAAARLDVNDRRRRLTGDVTVERGADKKKVRVTALGTQGGMRLTLLLDPEGQVRFKPTDLGLLDAQQAELTKLVQEGHGVVLTAAPADGGRTSTFYTLLKLHDAYTQNVQSVELDVQDVPEGVRQNRWDPQAEGPEFGTLVRSIIRRDPDVLGVAELPDQQTAKEICKAEPERTRVYASLRAGSALEAIEAWVRTVGAPAEAARVLHGAVAQKLVRKLCQNCRIPYQPAPDLLKRLGLPPEKVKQLFKKGGQVLIKNKPETCPACQGTGYIGQTACFEVYPLGQAERDLIAKQDWAGLKSELRKKQLPSMSQAALKKAVDGTTSVEEVSRISAPAEAPPRPAAQPAAPAGKPA